MAINTGIRRSADNLLQVAGFLKLADKLVRERDYISALEQIARARAKDPTNAYAKAYEQRVHLLLSALSEKKPTGSRQISFDQNPPNSFSQHLENIANHPIQDAGKTFNKSPNHQSMSPQHSSSEYSHENHDTTGWGREMENPELRDIEIRRCLRAAEELLRTQRLDEAMNSLMPALLLDPLNENIVQLGRRIRDAWGMQFAHRWRDQQRQEEEAKRKREERENNIRECIARAMQFSGLGDFAEALATVGRGYLIDPFNQDLAACEDRLLQAVALRSGRLDDERSGPREMGNTIESDAKARLLQHLDNAQRLLDEDRFEDALSQVALAMIDARKKPSPEDTRRPSLESLSEDRSTTSLPAAQPKVVSSVTAELGRPILVLLDEAKQLAGRNGFDHALNKLFAAAALIPADGSLIHLDREIGRRFMEYYTLSLAMKTTQDVRQDSDSMRASGESPKASAILERSNPVPESPDERTQRFAIPLHRKEQQVESEDLTERGNDNGISVIREYVQKSLQDLDAMQLSDASIEACRAAAEDNSRSDVRSYAEMIATLAQETKDRAHVDPMAGSYEVARQQAKELLYTLCYEEIFQGIDRGLEIMPESTILAARKTEVEQSFEECKKSAPSVKVAKDAGHDLAAKNPPNPKRSKKLPKEQMEIFFSRDMVQRKAQGWS